MQHVHNLKKVNEDDHGIMEICIECKMKIVSKKDPRNGRIDNKKYIKNHLRDTAQPFGRTSKVFGKYYGAEAGYINRFKK